MTMAEESQKTDKEVVVVPQSEVKTEVPVEKPVSVEKTVEEGKVPEPETVKTPATEEEGKIAQPISFKEESNVVADLPDPEKKALNELKLLIQEALNNHEFTVPPPQAAAPVKEEEKPSSESETSAPVVTTEEKPEIVSEAPKIESEVLPTPPATEESVVVTEVAEPVVSKIEEDDAKTVEAIEETIVAVSPPCPPPTEEPVKETEEVVTAETKEEPELPKSPPEEVFIYGIPLLGDSERSDTLLLKFLRARDFKPKETLAMIKKTVQWRKEFGTDALLEEDLGKTDLDKVVFTHGVDREGHPVCYNVYGEFQDKDLYNNNFSDEEKRTKFLKWRIQFLEKSIKNLEFSPEGVCTIVQVNDLKNAPGPHRRELRMTTNQALQLLQDNYPEFVAKQVFVNVPWWYLAFHRMISPFLTQRSKSKFVFAGPSRTADTLFKYIRPEQVPVRYGGLSREGEQEFTIDDAAIEVTIKPATKHSVEIPVSETCNLVWELRVVGWEVSYGAEFVPNEGYTLIVQKKAKIAATTDELIICNSFKITSPGKVVFTIDNQSSKKKKLLYRFKTKSSSD